MSWHARPATREDTPLILGIAGPTKSGKTYSAHRLAIGLANGGTIVMLNAEGRRGHQYADKFKYTAVDITRPYGPDRYEDAIVYIATLKPAVLIIDSASHMHDGPGGLLEWHDAELDRIAGKSDEKKRHQSSGTAWIKPKAAENKFIYTLQELEIPVILCFRAKQKYELPSYKELGWQPIAGERITFETLFTVVLPPHSKGVPDLKLSELREPFDTMIPAGKPIDENLGRQLAEWAKGAKATQAAAAAALNAPADPAQAVVLEELTAALKKYGLDGQSDAEKKRRQDLLDSVFGTRSWPVITKLPVEKLRSGLAEIRDRNEPADGAGEEGAA